nr:Chain s, model substrate polypeptide [Homo sapiens]
NENVSARLGGASIAV